MRGRRERGGFSLLELLIVVVIVSVLLVVAVDRLLVLRFEAERASVQTVIGALRSGLYINFAGAAARGDLKRIDVAAGSNPMLHLSEMPEAYAGEFYGPDPKVFEPGTWYFDLQNRSLVYLVRYPQQFVTSLPGPPRLRLAVQPDYDDLDRNGRFDAGRDPVRGLKLVPLEPFFWKNEGGKQQ